jgi:hypothetical protein
MPRMQPVPLGDTFKQGNTPAQPGQTDLTAPDFNFAAMGSRADIALIITVETNGKVTFYNHPATPEKLKNMEQLHPYPTGKLYDTYVLTLAIYEDEHDASILRVGGWNAGPPRVMYS